jgi:hypothetical protein
MKYALYNGNATHLTSDRSKSSDAPAGPPPRCLRFYPAARSTHEFIKKISHILIPSTSSSSVAAPCDCPILDADVHSPRYYRAPHLPPLARTPSCVPLTPSCRACCPPDRPKPGAGGAAGGGARACYWCWMLVVLACRHSPPGTGAPPPLCCKYIFQMF